MVATLKSTNVRSFDTAQLDALAELFFQPRNRYPVPKTWPPAGAERLAVETDGETIVGWAWGRGPAILLAHGWEGAAAQLQVLGDALVASGRRAVAFDLPAHGESTGSWVSLPRMAEALRDVEEALGPFEGVAAHSLGGGASVLAQLAVPKMLLLAPAADPTHFIRGFAKLLGVPEALEPELFAAIGRKAGMTVEELYLPRIAREYAGGSISFIVGYWKRFQKNPSC